MREKVKRFAVVFVYSDRTEGYAARAAAVHDLRWGNMLAPDEVRVYNDAAERWETTTADALIAANVPPPR